MALKNNSTTSVSISGLSYANLLEDLYNAVQDNDEFKNSFSDFTSAEAVRLLSEMYCYVAEQLTNRIDIIGKELFLDTASTNSLSRLLKLIGYKLDFPSAAGVTVNTSIIGENYNDKAVLLSKGINYNNDGETLKPEVDNAFFGFNAKNGNTHFEFITKDETTQKFNYLKSVNFTGPAEQLPAYEGTTKYQAYTINTLAKQILTLPGSVIKNSVRIYYRIKDIVNETFVPAELTEVDNFFSRAALTAQRGYYTARNLGSGVCEIVLQPGSADLKAEIIIMYRVGGGIAGNIDVGSINNTRTWDASSTLKIYNITAGCGGIDELTADEIRESVPQEIRNSYVPVSEEDYEYLFPSLDSRIKFIKAYGEKSQEATALANTYGYYVNPLNVWLLVLKQNQAFDTAYETIEGLTNYVNDICFQILDINPRFNEKYQVNRASIGSIIDEDTLQNYYDSDELTYTIPIDDNGIKCFENGDSDIIITTKPYVESQGKSGLQFFNKQDCVYTNLEDKYYIEQDGSALSTFTTISSDRSYAYRSDNWDLYKESQSDTVTFSENVTVNIKINSNDEVEFNISQGSYTKQQLASAINAGIPFTTQMVRLKEDISSTPASETQFNLENQVHGTLTFYIQKSGETNKTSFTVTAADSDNYGLVRDRINEQLQASTLKDDFLAVIFRENDCATLAIVANCQFTFSESNSDYSSSKGYYTHYLDNEDSYQAASISSSEVDIPSEYYLTWPAYTTATIAYVDTSSGKIILQFDASAEDPSLKIISSSNMFNDIFVISSASAETIKKYRRLTCTYDQSTNTGNLIIKTTSSKDLITYPIYITIFGTTNTTILLGDYYTNIDSYIPKESVTIRNLLKRNKIVNLYSTKYIVDDEGNATEDYYANEYELKFTTNKIQENTYAQIGNGEGNAKLISELAGDKILDYNTSSDILYIKVDGVDFTAKTIKVDSNYYTISPTTTSDKYVGYAKIPLNIFYKKTMSDFLNYLIDIFTKYDSTSQTNIVYLKKISTESTLGVETTSASCLSSIDLSGTDLNIAQYLFKVDNNLIVRSDEGVLNPTQITYKTYGINPSQKYVINGKMDFELKINSQTYSATDINTGIGIESLKKSIDANANINQYVTLENNRIVFKRLRSGDSIYLKLKYSDYTVRNDWQNMFEDTFTDIPSTIVGDYSGYLELKKTNSGDFYIIKSLDSDGDNAYTMYIENNGAFPCGDVYLHMYEDYQNDHVVSQTSDGIYTYTDEYVWNSLLEDRKMMLASHKFRQPRFISFDLNVTCYIPNAIGINMLSTYQKYVTDYLREAYNIYNAPIGTDISETDIAFNIKNNVNNITTVEVNYLGTDGLISDVESVYAASEYNQKLILASNEYVTESISGLNTQTQTRGLIVTIKYNKV